MNPGTDWIEQARRVLDALRAPIPADDAGGGHSADCRWCPVCQAAAVVRGDRPEVTAALADALTATASALRTFAAAAGAPATNAAAGAPATSAAAGAPAPNAAGGPARNAVAPDQEEDGPPAPPVQRIDIS